MDASTLSPGLRFTYSSSIVYWFFLSSGFGSGVTSTAFGLVVSRDGWGGGQSHATRTVNAPRRVFNRSGSTIGDWVDHVDTFMHRDISHWLLLVAMFTGLNLREGRARGHVRTRRVRRGRGGHPRPAHIVVVVCSKAPYEDRQDNPYDSKRAFNVHLVLFTLCVL